MTTSMPALLAIATLSATAAAAEKPKPAKVTVILRGARTATDNKAMIAALSGVKGITYSGDKVIVGAKPRYFSDPFIVSIADTNTTNVGALAAAVSKAKTSARKDLPPKANIVLFTDDEITEETVTSLRGALRKVNGLDVDAPGGLGGFPAKGYYWVRLEDAGGATLDEIRAALRKAQIKVNWTKP